MEVSGSDQLFRTSCQGEMAFEGCMGGPLLLPPMGLLQELVTVGMESCARPSQWFLSESCWRADGLGQWVGTVWTVGMVDPPNPYLFLSGHFTWNGLTCPQMPAPQQ